jgi:hypothetical protein
MTDWSVDVTDNLLAASRRLWPAIDATRASITVTPSASGVMATIRERPSGRIVFRIFEVSGTGTVYLVPTWVSSPSAMDEALANQQERVRLVVA